MDSVTLPPIWKRFVRNSLKSLGKLIPQSSEGGEMVLTDDAISDLLTVQEAKGWLFRCLKLRVMETAGQVSNKVLSAIGIKTVGIKELTACWPRMDDIDENKLEFKLEMEQKPHQWWDSFFKHLLAALPSLNISELKQTPIFKTESRFNLRTHLPCPVIFMKRQNDDVKTWRPETFDRLIFDSQDEKHCLEKMFPRPYSTGALVELIVELHLENALDASLGTREQIWADLMFIMNNFSEYERVLAAKKLDSKNFSFSIPVR